MILSKEEKTLKKIMHQLLQRRNEIWRKEKRYVFKEIDEFLAIMDDELKKIKTIRKIKDQKLQKMEAESVGRIIKTTIDGVKDFLKRHRKK